MFNMSFYLFYVSFALERFSPYFESHIEHLCIQASPGTRDLLEVALREILDPSQSFEPSILPAETAPKQSANQLLPGSPASHQVLRTNAAADARPDQATPPSGARKRARASNIAPKEHRPAKERRVRFSNPLTTRTHASATNTLSLDQHLMSCPAPCSSQALSTPSASTSSDPITSPLLPSPLDIVRNIFDQVIAPGLVEASPTAQLVKQHLYRTLLVSYATAELASFSNSGITPDALFKLTMRALQLAGLITDS